MFYASWRKAGQNKYAKRRKIPLPTSMMQLHQSKHRVSNAIASHHHRLAKQNLKPKLSLRNFSLGFQKL